MEGMARAGQVLQSGFALVKNEHSVVLIGLLHETDGAGKASFASCVIVVDRPIHVASHTRMR